MTIRELVHRANCGKFGVCGPWRTEENVTYFLSGPMRTARLYHYSTLMLEWDLKNGGYVYMSEGHGSVSDQNGMNTAFKVLGFPLYFSRKGGSSILALDNPLDFKRLPKYIRDSPSFFLGNRI